jgi:hypothetical protein
MGTSDDMSQPGIPSRGARVIVRTSAGFGVVKTGGKKTTKLKPIASPFSARVADFPTSTPASEDFVDTPRESY